MPQIPKTQWYTAARFKVIPIQNSQRCNIGVEYGYRRSLKGCSPKEIDKQIELLKQQNIQARSKISRNNHTDIPAGTPFLEVFDKKSVQNLETQWAKMGIDLPTNRFDVYKKNLQLNGGR